MRIDTTDRQRMGIFRTKAVDHIRIIIFRDLTQFFLQLRLVTIGVYRVLTESITYDIVFICRAGIRPGYRHTESPRCFRICGCRERHCQRHVGVFPATTCDSSPDSQPSLLEASLCNASAITGSMILQTHSTLINEILF